MNLEEKNLEKLSEQATAMQAQLRALAGGMVVFQQMIDNLKISNPSEYEDVSSLNLSLLHLSNRTYNAICRSLRIKNNEVTVGKVAEAYPTLQKLSRVRNIGRKSIKELVLAMQSLGYWEDWDLSLI